MKRLILVLFTFVLAACASDPYSIPYTPPEPAAPEVRAPSDPNQDLTQALGLRRAPADLGYVEKIFNPCSFGLSGHAGCRNQYISVVHFQLLCRDSEGTVSAVPLRLRPIVAERVQWKVGSQSGGTQTDSNGYGQLSVLSERSVRGQRLTLRIGPQFVAFTVSEVSKVVLPKNFCRGGSFAGIFSPSQLN